MSSEEISAMKARAGAMRSEANSTFDQKMVECDKKILDLGCADDARARLQASLAEASALDKKWKEAEIERRRVEREARQQKEAIDMERRRAKIQAEEEERNKRRAEQARKDAEVKRMEPTHIAEKQARDRKRAEHARQLDEKARKNAADQKRKADEAVAHAAKEEAAKKNATKDSLVCGLSFGQVCPGGK
jgi:colicin import membrane protein